MTEKRLVWDWPTRLFHWALVLTIGGAYVTAELVDDWMQYHIWLGYTTLTLLLFRLSWGFVGTRHARFSKFVRGPSAVRRYLRALRSGTGQQSVGHNPLGALSVLAMLLALVVQVGLGFFSSDDFFYAGPYNGLLSEPISDAVTELHETNFGVVVVLVAIHVAAVLWYRVRKKQDLIGPMITGRKPADVVPPDAAIDGSAPWRAALVLALAALAVWVLVAAAPPPADPFAF